MTDRDTLDLQAAVIATHRAMMKMMRGMLVLLREEPEAVTSEVISHLNEAMELLDRSMEHLK